MDPLALLFVLWHCYWSSDSVIGLLLLPSCQHGCQTVLSWCAASPAVNPLVAVFTGGWSGQYKAVLNFYCPWVTGRLLWSFRYCMTNGWCVVCRSSAMPGLDNLGCYSEGEGFL